MPRHSVFTEYVFEWDPRKAEANAAKHGVSFDDAVTVFLDANALDGPDLSHSECRSTVSAAGPSRRRALAHGGLHAQEKWQCRNDPDHQRAAGESPRTHGVRGEGLTTRIFPSRRPNSSGRCDEWGGLRLVTNRAD
jgi:uncharacterized DUF497 family protein